MPLLAKLTPTTFVSPIALPAHPLHRTATALVAPRRRPAMSSATPPAPAPAQKQLFAVRLFDVPDSGALRAANRPAHLDWVAAPATGVRFAGALRPAHDAPPLGSLIVLSAPSADAVAATLAGDPFATGGVFASREVRAWRRGLTAGLHAPDSPNDLYAVWCVDRADPDARGLRAQTRPAHLEWWKAAGRVGMIGPFPDGDGAVGTLIVCDGTSVDEVTEWAATDPYNKAGLFASVDVYAFKRVFDEGWDE